MHSQRQLYITFLGLMIVVCFGFYVAESLVSILYTFKFMLFKTRKKPELWSVLLPKDLLKYHNISRTYKKKILFLQRLVFWLKM